MIRTLLLLLSCCLFAAATSVSLDQQGEPFQPVKGKGMRVLHLKIRLYLVLDQICPFCSDGKSRMQFEEQMLEDLWNIVQALKSGLTGV